MSFVPYVFTFVGSYVDQYSLALIWGNKLGTGVSEQDLDFKICQNRTPAILLMFLLRGVED